MRVAALVVSVLAVWASVSDGQLPVLTKTVIDDGDNGPGEIAIGRPYVPVPPLVKRLYCVEMNGDLVEYRYDPNSPTSWGKQVILAGVYYNGVTIGPGRNEACERMYCTKRNQLYEVWCEGGTWHENLLLELGDPWLGYVVIGPGRNDGVNRVYASSTDPRIYELTYVGPGPQDWHIEIVDLNMSCEDIGPGQNDGVNRIYGVGGHQGDEQWTVYELTYDPGPGAFIRRPVYTWDWQEDPWPSQLVGVTLAGARGDGKMRIYYKDMYCGINEISYETNEWVNRSVASNRPIEYYYGAGMHGWEGPFAWGVIWKEDIGPFFLFVGGEDLVEPPQGPTGHVFVLGYRASTQSWATYCIGDMGRWGVDVAVGDVRSPGDYALYAISMDGQLAEFYPQK